MPFFDLQIKKNDAYIFTSFGAMGVHTKMSEQGKKELSTIHL